MTKKLSPHDRFTRASLTHPKIAEEFFQKNLPEKIKKIIDFSSLELKKEIKKIEQARVKMQQERVKAQQEPLKMAKAMVSNGIELATVAKITGYSQKDLKKIVS